MHTHQHTDKKKKATHFRVSVLEQGDADVRKQD